MFRDKNESEENNFWISYADLMAGLLFVFILLIGAIISKSMILKSDLNAKEALLGQKSSNLSKNEKILRLKIDEIAKLNKMLIESNTREVELKDKIILSQTLLKKDKEKIAKNKKSLKDYEGKILILSNELGSSKDKVKIRDDKLLKLLNAMDEKKSKYDSLLANLRAQKAKIKSLTGIKLRVVEALKNALGNKINIDKKTGSLRLASNILFTRGKSTLKPEAKVELKKAFENYIGILVRDKNIRPHLDKIIIEGHTDSDGSYIFNLQLSQDRALAVMEYLLSLEFSKRYNIRPLMIASGRAYLDVIKRKGVEDKEASRRIEIKFRLKNEDAMNEIEKVLDAK
ncbi:MAG: OmpA family protein [Sulfurovum sp.]